MKKSDIAMLVLIASLSIMVAFFVANSIPLLKPSDKGVKVKTVQSISSKVVSPDQRVFNAQATNPTVETVIGSSSAK